MSFIKIRTSHEGTRAYGKFIIRKSDAHSVYMDRNIVDRAAHIAHLALTEEELDRYSRDLGEILDYFEMLDGAPEADSVGFNPVEIADALRDDVPKTEVPPEECTKDMKTYDGYIRGPKLS